MVIGFADAHEIQPNPQCLTCALFTLPFAVRVCACLCHRPSTMSNWFLTKQPSLNLLLKLCCRLHSAWIWNITWFFSPFLDFLCTTRVYKLSNPLCDIEATASGFHWSGKVTHAQLYQPFTLWKGYRAHIFNHFITVPWNFVPTRPAGPSSKAEF